jgi:hypothetical protein
MAIEILLEMGRTFHHHLRHDLESVLYVIIWMCTHMEGPEVERKDSTKLTIRKWSNMELDLRELGHLKSGHIDDADRAIIREFTPYWSDFGPFVLKLIRAFFPSRASEANSINPDVMVSILEAAEKHVKEPPSSGLSVEPTDVETEMHEYNVLKYGKDYRQGQDEAPRKRIKTTTTQHDTQPRAPTRRSSRSTTSSRTAVSSRPIRSSKLRITTSESQGQGQKFGTTI